MANRFGSLQIDPVQSTNGHESDSSESSQDSEDDDEYSSSESSNSSHGEKEDESESEEEEEEEPESDEEEAPPLSPNSSAFNRAPPITLRKRANATKKNIPSKQVQRIQEEQRQKQLVEVQSKQEETHHHKGSEKEVSGTMTLGILVFPLLYFSPSVCVSVHWRSGSGCEQQLLFLFLVIGCVRNPPTFNTGN